MEFQSFTKIPRLTREMIITEKIDGTNGIIAIGDNGEFQVGSRNRWLTDELGNIVGDNAGFAAWAVKNRAELERLGPGYHYGEWWGPGIQRGYDLKEKRFSLFNVSRWSINDARPDCCSVVPTLYTGLFSTEIICDILNALKVEGSRAAPGFMRPEGVVIYHVAAKQMFKKTIEGDEKPKGSNEAG